MREHVRQDRPRPRQHVRWREGQQLRDQWSGSELQEVDDDVRNEQSLETLGALRVFGGAPLINNYGIHERFHVKQPFAGDRNSRVWHFGKLSQRDVCDRPLVAAQSVPQRCGVGVTERLILD